MDVGEGGFGWDFYEGNKSKFLTQGALRSLSHETCDFEPITFLDCFRTDFM